MMDSLSLTGYADGFIIVVAELLVVLRVLPYCDIRGIWAQVVLRNLPEVSVFAEILPRSGFRGKFLRNYKYRKFSSFGRSG
jgi:hypothetical protein